MKRATFSFAAFAITWVVLSVGSILTVQALTADEELWMVVAWMAGTLGGTLGLLAALVTADVLNG